MGDSDEVKRKAGVPSWQLKPSVSLQDSQNAGQDTPLKPMASRASIIEDARRFLLQDEVQNAPVEKRVAFLEDKGLESHEIRELLGVTRNSEGTSPKQEPSTHSKTTSNDQTPRQPPDSSPSLIAPINRDAPPIITYPEFLVTPARPAPLVTAGRLLATLYLFGGLSTLLYGTNHYLITPMIAALTSSRHELAGASQKNLDRFLAKLEGMVSETLILASPSHQDESEDEDSSSDPTELFHRDIGVQTSLPTSPSFSHPRSPQPFTTILEDQTNRLDRITSHIKDLNEVSVLEDQGFSDLSTCTNILHEYLDNLAYVSPTHAYGSGGLYGSHIQRAEPADDEIAKVKAQIRGVKGVLLSAKSFPTGTWQSRAR